MKQFISLAIIIIVMASCNSKKDSTLVTEEKKAEPKSYILDSLLRYNSEAELIAAFGQENVGRDTVQYPKEEPFMISTLYPNTNNEVEFDWVDSKTFTKLFRITLHKDSSAWSTHGVKIGSTLNELIQLNGQDFIIGGLGDGFNDGGVSWQGGNLAVTNLVIYLGTHYKIPENEAASLTGSISSKSPLVLKSNPFVKEIYMEK